MMTRRFFLLAAAGVVPAAALRADDSAPVPLIEWAYYSTNAPVDLPADSAYQSSFGVLVRVWDARPQVEGFRVTLHYQAGGYDRVITKLVDRQREGEGWTDAGFDLGQPARVVSIRALSLDGCGSSEARG